MYRVNYNTKGFTLIELLVVIGIIAILAAIAIPNYQEALTRSKVARFMRDCRAAEYAIEGYMVDRGIYPGADRYPVNSDGSPWQAGPSYPGTGYLTRYLTTPVSYLNKLPVDIFYNREDVSTVLPLRKTMIYSNDMQNRYLFGTTYQRNYVSWNYAILKGEHTLFGERPSNAIWMIASAGPDADRDHGRDRISTGDPTDIVQYDPTNGTISNGDLFFFGPGIGFGSNE